MKSWNHTQQNNIWSHSPPGPSNQGCSGKSLVSQPGSQSSRAKWWHPELHHEQWKSPREQQINRHDTHDTNPAKCHTQQGQLIPQDQLSTNNRMTIGLTHKITINTDPTVTYLHHGATKYSHEGTSEILSHSWSDGSGYS